MITEEPPLRYRSVGEFYNLPRHAHTHERGISVHQRSDHRHSPRGGLRTTQCIEHFVMAQEHRKAAQSSRISWSGQSPSTSGKL